jgi:hypothetical protein
MKGAVVRSCSIVINGPATPGSVGEVRWGDGSTQLEI